MERTLPPRCEDLFQKHDELFDEYDQGVPDPVRHAFVSGYLSAHDGRTSFCSYIFEKTAAAETVTALLKGIQECVTDHVTSGNGFVDGYQLLLKDKIKYSPLRQRAFQAFVDGVADGYTILMEPEHPDAKAVHAFAKAATKQIGIMAFPLYEFQELAWPYPEISYFQKGHAMAHTLPSPEKEELLFALILGLSGNLGFARQLKSAFDDHDVEAIIVDTVKSRPDRRISPSHVMDTLRRYCDGNPTLIEAINVAARTITTLETQKKTRPFHPHL